MANNAEAPLSAPPPTRRCTSERGNGQQCCAITPAVVRTTATAPTITIVASLAVVPRPRPQGTPPGRPPPAPNHDSTDPTSRTPIARCKAKTYGAAEAAKSALSPPLPSQYSSNACAIAANATSVKWQRQMERTLEERRRDRYRNAQPTELERRPRGDLEK